MVGFVHSIAITRGNEVKWQENYKALWMPFGAMMVAVNRWQRDDGRDDLLRLFDEAIAVLADGLPELRPGAKR